MEPYSKAVAAVILSVLCIKCLITSFTELKSNIKCKDTLGFCISQVFLDIVDWGVAIAALERDSILYLIIGILLGFIAHILLMEMINALVKSSK